MALRFCHCSIDRIDDDVCPMYTTSFDEPFCQLASSQLGLLINYNVFNCHHYMCSIISSLIVMYNTTYETSLHNYSDNSYIYMYMMKDVYTK